MKHVVHMLHTALHLPEHHLLKERQLLERLDNLKQQLSPLEKVACVSQHLYAIISPLLHQKKTNGISDLLFFWAGLYESAEW